MSSLSIGWEYLTGYSVAAEKQDGPIEWPPHPGRVFMALAAAWFETEPLSGDQSHTRWGGEGDALRWLETLNDPELHLPRVDPEFARSKAKVYVPVNDTPIGDKPGILQSVAGWPRSKKERFFWCVWVGHEPCSMHWPQASGVDEHLDALDGLCRKVTRIGHSSSLVRMWATSEPSASRSDETWVADNALGEQHCRVATEGMLDALPTQTNIPRILQFAEMDSRIRSNTGNVQKQAKAEYEETFGEKWRKSASPPPLLRPKVGISRGYHRATVAETETAKQQTLFDSDVLVLTHVNGSRLPVVSTLTVTRALRNTIMSGSDVQPVPSWVSGHEPNGQPLRSDDDGHMACIALPFVSHEHADGHLLGVGLVFPRSVDHRERGRVLGKFLLDQQTGQPRRVQLLLGRLGEWTVRKRDWSESRWTLAPEAWTAFPNGATTWASVTPVVLDKFPKSARQDDRLAWTNEVAGIVAAACKRIGLPEPNAIDIDTTSWHLGSPRATGKTRPLRGHTGMSSTASASLGDGFPAFPARGTNAPRPQVHVFLHFAEPVIGPVLLGAGRYLGYGLCKPLKERHE